MRNPLLSRARGLVLALCSVPMLAGVGLALPASAGAYATAGPAPVPGSPGLPDGRVYEEVSPANKNGNQAAAELEGMPGRIWAAPDGNSAAFSDSGPVGNSATGVQLFTVARRSVGGWESYGALPRSEGAQVFGLQAGNNTNPEEVGFSTDLNKTLFAASAPFVPSQPEGDFFDGYVYDIGAGLPVWLGEPSITDALSGKFGPSQINPRGYIAGASSDLSVVYFGFSGTLTPEDDLPNPSLGGVSRAQVIEREGGEGLGGAGFYEWHEGRLSSAGVLPDGSLDPYGAVPAGFIPGGNGQDADKTQNQVSEDGTKAFFVSPDPRSRHPASDVPQLYVRETAADGRQHTVLVSRDTLLPAVNGLPAPAPHGPLPSFVPEESDPNSYVWATPNGSRAFFLSTDQLTADAPADESGKLYEFNLDTETLTYLSGATPTTTGQGFLSKATVLASSQDGSRLLFVKFVGERGIEPLELDLWTDGPEGPADGRVTPIASLHDVGSEESLAFRATRAASDGSAFVFQTKEAFPDFHFNNGGGSFYQVYRYEVATNSLMCLSCPPAGVTPTGSAHLSNDQPRYDNDNVSTLLNKNRGISEDGARVFFDTPDSLVPWDTSTAPPIQYSSGPGVPQGYDVYEWENGRLFLISTGKSDKNSFVGDNSANGDDVFFSTAEGLVPGDTDGGYDVYDARVPHPGDNPPPSAVPCEGDVCQGPPSVPSLLGAPASATFSGLGNPAAPAPAAKAKQPPKKKIKKKIKKKGPKKRNAGNQGKKSGSKAKGKG